MNLSTSLLRLIKKTDPYHFHLMQKTNKRVSERLTTTNNTSINLNVYNSGKVKIITYKHTIRLGQTVTELMWKI